MGDCNGRTAEQYLLKKLHPEKIISEARFSKDDVLIGKSNFLLDLFDSNGVVKDRRGEFIYIRPNGSSVVDYCCVSLEVVNLAKSF